MAASAPESISSDHAEPPIAIRAKRYPLPTMGEWLSFALQCALVVAVQEIDDSIRGWIWPPNIGMAAANARHIVELEQRLHVFVEPGIQNFFVQSPSLLGRTMSWSVVSGVANTAYMGMHVFVTLAVGMWVFLRHRDWFPRLRNVMIVTSLICLLVYELYPMTPPRMTPGLTWDGYPFHFQDTMRPLIGTGKLTGIPIVYNPLSAMPSLHVAWATAIGLAVFLLARSWPMKLVGLVYPLLVTAVTIVTANHYLADAFAAGCVVAFSVLLVWGSEKCIRGRRHRMPDLPGRNSRGVRC